MVFENRKKRLVWNCAKSFSWFDCEISQMRFIPVLNAGGSIAEHVAANVKEHTSNGYDWDMDFRTIY